MPRQREFVIEDVLDKAIRVFWAQGFETTSVRDLTSAMGISTSSLYEVFKDKHGVYIAALERYCVFEQERLRAIGITATGPTEFITRLFVSLDAPTPHHPLIRGSMAFNAVVEFGKRNAEVTAILLRHYTKIVEIITHVIASWQQAGEIQTTAAAETVASLLVSTLIGIVTITSVEGHFTQRDAITQLMLETLKIT